MAVWIETTRFETLTDDGQVHVDVRPPISEPEFDADIDPDYNPVCGCPGPRAPGAGSALAARPAGNAFTGRGGCNAHRQ
jgi:hypothetical protein